MTKAKKVLVYAMTPELCEALREMNLWRHTSWTALGAMSQAWRVIHRVCQALDAQIVTTPAKKRKGKR